MNYDGLWALTVSLTLKIAAIFFPVQITPTYDDVSLYQVWSQKVQQFRKYHPDK